MSTDLEQLRELFVAESLEHLDSMEGDLLELQERPADPELIGALFRAVHSIKGSSGTYGLTHLRELAHHAETLMSRVRNEEVAVSAPVVEALLSAVDCLRFMVQAAQSGEDEPAPNGPSCVAALEAAMQASTEPGAASSAGPRRTWTVAVTPDADVFIMCVEPLSVLEALAELGELSLTCAHDKLPSLEEMDPESCYLSWSGTLKTEQSRETIEEALSWFDGVGGYALEAAPAPAPVPPPAKPSEGAAPSTAPQRGAAPPSTTMRVDVRKVDRLLNMLGELVIGQAMLTQIAANFDASRLTDLHAAIQRIASDTRSLQDAVMEVRMLPASHLLRRMPRIVHDVSRVLGKSVELEIHGESTEIDKRVLEDLSDPFVHLLRNALDHGIETPAERVAAGKPETGRIRIHAFHRGGFVHIEISDDGRGLDEARILETAIRKQLVPSDSTLENVNIVDLLFMPGFSTAAAVTSVSGRGVGMDVVRRNVERLNGSVGATWKPGQGSTFTVRIPLTLAIIDGQLLRIGQERYVIPVLTIVECLQASRLHRRRLPHGAEVFSFRGGDVPILDMRAVMGVPREAACDKDIVVVAESGSGRIGLWVDELLVQQQVVVKSLQENYGTARGFSGATVLGDGEVAMILDVQEIAAHANHRTRAASTGALAATLH